MREWSRQGRALQAGTPAAPLLLPRPCLMLVTEPIERDRLVEIVRAAVAGGVNAVQLRDTSASPRDLTLTSAVLKLFLPRTLLLVNGSPSVARGARVSGVHLPEHGVGSARARQAVGGHRLIGRSVHSVAAAQKAADEGANYLVAGTIFASASHPDRSGAGLDYLRAVCAAVSVPVIAIGGITPQRVEGCLAAGAVGVAVLSPLMRAADPRAAAQAFWRELNHD